MIITYRVYPGGGSAVACAPSIEGDEMTRQDDTSCFCTLHVPLLDSWTDGTAVWTRLIIFYQYQ